MTDQQLHDLIAAIECQAHVNALCASMLYAQQADNIGLLEASATGINIALADLNEIHMRCDGRLFAEDAERIANEGAQ